MEPWKDNSESTGRKEIHKLYLHVGFRAIGLVHITGDPEGMVSIHLHFDGYESTDTGYSMPSVDDDMQFDLSHADEGVIGWNFYGDWTRFDYGGKTMEEAMPSYEEVFGEEY